MKTVYYTVSLARYITDNKAKSHLVKSQYRGTQFNVIVQVLRT